MKAINTAFGKYASFGPVFLRVILGIGFVVHGYTKFDRDGGVSATGTAFADNLGIPAGEIVAPVVGALEVGLGILLIVGLATRVSSIVLSAILFGAIVYVKNEGFLFNGNQAGAELDLVYIAGLFSLVLSGPGALSLDGILKQDETVIDLRSTSEPVVDVTQEDVVMT